MTSQIKSRDRVKNLAEVYTNAREVNAMLDLVLKEKSPEEIISYRFLEPACGNGNFLIEILRRKLNEVKLKYGSKHLSVYQFYMARAVSTIYAVDICAQNVEESIERLFSEIKSEFSLNKGSEYPTEGFMSLIHYVLRSNIIIGDTIKNANEITFIEFSVKGKSFKRKFFKLDELTNKNPVPFQTIDEKHYLKIGQEVYNKKYEPYQNFSTNSLIGYASNNNL